MGLLGTLGLKPTKAMLAKGSGKAPGGGAQAADAAGKVSDALPRERLDKLKDALKKALAVGGKAAEQVQKRVDDAEQAIKDAARQGVKEAADKAHRAIDVVEMVIDDALSDQKDKDGKSKTDELTDELKRKAEEELRRRLNNLKKNIDKARALPGKLADEVKRRAAEAEQLLEDAVKAGVKSAVDKAHRALDAVESAVDDALGGAGNQEQGEAGEAETAKAQEKEAQDLRNEMAEDLKSIESKDSRAKVEALMKALEADLKKAQDIKLPARRLLALAKLAVQARAARKAAAALAAADAKAKGGAQAKPGDGMKSPEMVALVARFQAVMKEIKTLEAAQSPKAAELKKAAIAAGNLSTSPKGIVDANKALDQVEARIEDAKREAQEAQAQDTKAQDAKAQDAKKGQNEAAEAGADGKLPDAKKQADEGRAKVAELEQRYLKAMSSQMDSERKKWLADALARMRADCDELEKLGTAREQKNLRSTMLWFENTVKQHEREAAGTANDKLPDIAKRVAEARKRLKALADRGHKALEADPGNTNGKWLEEVVAGTEGRISDFEKRATQTEADSLDAHFEWFEGNVAGMEDGAKRAAEQAKAEGKPGDPKATDPDAGRAQDQNTAKPAAPESPELKKVKAQFKSVMAELDKFEKEGLAGVEALKKAAVDAGNLATSPKGIQKAKAALDKVKADAAKAHADAAKAKADAEQEAARTYDIVVGARKLQGVHKAEAVKALHAEAGRLDGMLKIGWDYHVEQMNLPAQLPFAAWLTSGVDAVKSLVTGRDAAKIPDLNIWDPARELLIEARKLEKAGDINAWAALLPKAQKSIEDARKKVGKYQDQMEDAAQTGVDAGRFVEDTAASAIGAIAEKEGGKPAKVAAQATAKMLFEEVEQITEWALGMRKEIDMKAVYKKGAEEAVGAIFKELVKGALKDPFKSLFGSYIGRAVDDKALAAMGIGRDAFMTGAQKYFAEFAAGQGAGLIKAALSKLMAGKTPSSPQALAEGVVVELTKGSAKQLIVDGIKEIAKAAVVPK